MIKAVSMQIVGDRGNKAVQMGRERRPPPVGLDSLPSVAIQHDSNAAAATCQHPGKYSSSGIVNKDLLVITAVLQST